MKALHALGGPGKVWIAERGVISTTIVLGKAQEIEFGAGSWVVTARPGIVLDDASAVTGAGVHRTQLLQKGTAAGPLILSAEFDALSGRTESEVVGRPTNDPELKAFDGGIKGAAIRGVRLTGTPENDDPKDVGVKLYGSWWSLHDVVIEHFAGDGLYSEWIVGKGGLRTNDTPEAWLTNVKIVANGGNGWTDRGPHDTIATDLIVANNAGWGIDVQHSEEHHSGGGLMLTAAHLYGNRTGGLRTQSGANIHAYGLESESNVGPGLLLRSNDNIVQGEFYANTTVGLQIGDESAWAAFNTVHLQSHNNFVAQVAWINSGDGNMVTGSLYAMRGQKVVEGKPNRGDSFMVASGGVTIAGAPATLPGGFVFGNDGGFFGAKLVETLNGQRLGQAPH